jgi:hypothetical protein
MRQSLQAFRQAHHLPESFGVALFEPKDFTGLARIDTASTELKQIRAQVIHAAESGPANRLDAINALTPVFRAALLAVNDSIGLRETEIDFAVNGFDDMLRRWCYQPGPADFETVYAGWLADSVRLSTQVHVYEHAGQVFHVQILNNLYGRIGLRVSPPAGEPVEVLDGALACPAQGFMQGLLREVVEVLAAR